MTYAICPLSVVPIRSSASDRSEQLSQFLFGELMQVLEFKGKAWVKVRSDIDQVEGWVRTAQLHFLGADTHRRFRENFAFNLELKESLRTPDFFQPITLGARLPGFDGMGFSFGGDRYTFSGRAVFPKYLKANADVLQSLVSMLLNAPYQHGGRTHLGIDGSGFVQLVYSLLGYALPRYAEQQLVWGRLVPFAQQVQVGDLLFFESFYKKRFYVGIALENGQVAHVHDRVRIDLYDHFGLFDTERGNYLHRLRIIKRLLPDFTASDSTSSSENTEKKKPTQQVLF